MKWSDIQDNRLHYAMGKNNKGGSLKVPDKALKLIEQYSFFKENKNDLISPDLKEFDLTEKLYPKEPAALKLAQLISVCETM